jgi:hypothetical protein
MGVQGLVDTLAGPGYCPRVGVPVAGSRRPRAVAVGGGGQVHVDTGSPGRAVIATIDAQGGVSTRQTRIPAATVAEPAPESVADPPPGAGRLVAAGDQAVIVAAGTRLERLGPQGGLTTLAGDPTGELAGVGPRQVDGAASQARFRSATSVARDQAGNVYVADHGGVDRAAGVVRFVNRSDQPVTFYAGTPEEVTVEAGHVATIAGRRPSDATPTEAGPVDGDGVRARRAVLPGTMTLAVDGDAVYVASARAVDDARARIAMLNVGGDALSRHGHTVRPGELAVVAGAGSTTIGAVGGIAAAAGRLVVADPARHRVYRLDQQGLRVVAGAEGLGANVGGFNGNRRPAVGARLNHPVDVAIGGDGDVYVADRDNGQVRVIDDGTIRAVAGNGLGLAWRCQADDAAVGRARRRPGGPAGVAVAGDATYVALADAHRIIRRDPSGRLTTVAGTGQAGMGGDGGPASDAQLDTPTALALGPDQGRLYVYDGGNARLRVINLSDRQLTAHGVTVPAAAMATLTGAAGGESLAAVASPPLIGLGAEAAAGQGRRIPHTSLGDVAVDAAGTVFVAEPPPYPDGGADRPAEHPQATAAGGRVRRLTREGELAAVVGAGATGSAGDCCTNPTAIAATPERLYVADAATRHVWLYNRTDQPVDAHGHTIPAGQPAVVAGNGQHGFTAHAADATTASLLSPSALAVTDDGGVYLAHLGITDPGPFGHYIHHLTADGTLTVAAGTGQPGYNGDTRPPRVTAINLPTDLATDRCGNLLVADAGNDRLRRLNLTGPCNQNRNTPTATNDSLPAITLTALVGGIAALAAAGWHWHHHRR